MYKRMELILSPKTENEYIPGRKPAYSRLSSGYYSAASMEEPEQK
jgi:hypothetical protein